ncbi:MAG: undecaprenyldiphospho-muramoylpentapeptide beta-N-acetylglucosaminyltransferase [Gallionellales bacterium 35-53-114]|jgi:UDP-N-acetylglucosamine--N-acetylmuramyl-(pentapeptide) pyrophosphoryl-undecaprenol N-acetylglucosamine transferase|nr:MAG: undecaprenyldiphospho-muramoylpentapeptide beta-N-acetylglucosaminyltransferase [Gallionellales bacterium 35-53-114]OYZ63915.1 MAG: undecaprenyldiphospho-muramoylpentapeptide beta-N-acetylglucosaminyltransferase [Gallionellales bacterium 24-53-125]OZB09255.1 MAG: undecaprenyldiphospho-muramoylpentapeptide beta-N-acetylglucosaminyltransferase [Gallionellales bacterium 39-52-133]
MAGGTGGHIFPALAVADVLRKDGWQVTWLGARNSMEAELVPKHGYEMAWVRFSGLRGNGIVRKLMLPFNLLIALWQSAVALFRYRPDVVLGMGGYITFPGGVMAALLRKPLLIHEQNSVAGMSNRALAKIATRVMSGFPDVLKQAEWCGNPVRDSIAALPEPQQRYKARSGVLNVLVVGGSLGAKAINECLPQALFCMPQEREPRVIHQTGKQHFAEVQELYHSAGIPAEVKPFLDDMAQYYAWADVVICRAGALTVAELAAAGVASILIPFPYAVDDHQTGNAKFLSDKGAAILLPQTELEARRLAAILEEMTREKAMSMAVAARALAHPAAAQRVAQVCKELAG